VIFAGRFSLPKTLTAKDLLSSLSFGARFVANDHVASRRNPVELSVGATVPSGSGVGAVGALASAHGDAALARPSAVHLRGLIVLDSAVWHLGPLGKVAGGRQTGNRLALASRWDLEVLAKAESQPPARTAAAGG
jgi:hypothetical protein